jgi:hypothetical protein
LSLPERIDSRFTARMGKVEDMRREERYAQSEREAKARADGTSAAGKRVAISTRVDGTAAHIIAAASTSDAATQAAMVDAEATSGSDPQERKPLSGKRRGGDEQGACAVCGKQRPLHSGLLSAHQKGLGKMCPGSRKPPA